MWNRMVENLLSVLEHFLAGCSSCFVEFSAALETLSFALDARRVKTVICSWCCLFNNKISSEISLILTIKALMQIQQIFFKILDAVEFLESSSPLLPVVSLHEYTGLLNNNN